MEGKMPGDYTDFHYPFAFVKTVRLVDEDGESSFCKYLVVVGANRIVYESFDAPAAKELAIELCRCAEVWASMNYDQLLPLLKGQKRKMDRYSRDLKRRKP